MNLSPEESESVITDAIAVLGLSIDMKTDPVLIRDILCEAKLDDFQTSFVPMKQFLDDIVSRPQCLAPLFEQIQWGLLKNGSAVLEFLKRALDEHWLAPSPNIIKSVHVTYIVEAITAAMCNSPVFFDEYVKHIRVKQQDIGIDSKHVLKSFIRKLPGSLNLFASAKAISLDMAMVYFRVTRELGGRPINKAAIDELYNGKKISFLEHKLLLPFCDKTHCVCNDWLRINIYEAGVTEYKNGFVMNAMAAHALSEDVLKSCHRESFQLRQVYPQSANQEFYKSLATDDNYVPVVALNEEWVRLYLSWNMAFILGELNNLHYLFPKLLIPSLLCASSENFLAVRIVSLWVSINNSMFLNFHDADKVTGPENRREMAQAWGEINQRYAEKLFNDRVDAKQDSFLISFQQRFARPYFKLFKQIMGFMQR